MNDDTISRRAAIDLWEKYHPTIAVDAMQYDAELRQLPSAQPEIEERTEEFAQNVPKEDLISRKAAIEAMSESLKRVFPEHRQIAEKCLKALPSAQPEPQWIPVSERLPEERGFYLVKVCAEYRPIRIYAFSPWDMDKERKFWINDGDSHSHVFNHFVEAWMPLPEPYKAERRTDGRD